MLDGTYGRPPRQRFRCVGDVVNVRTGEVRPFHRFTEVLPRRTTQASVCDTCDNHVAPHQGRVTTRSWHFPLEVVAGALVAVGSGSTYVRAADRARLEAGVPRLDPETGGQLVAEWLDTLAPVVLDAHAEHAWPSRLVLDSTRFMAVNPVTSSRQLAFTVLGAYGYPGRAVGRRRLWALRAYHRATAAEWEDFLRQLDCTVPPRVVVCDGSPEIENAVRAVWPAQPSPSFPIPFVFRCLFHLAENAREALAKDGITGGDTPEGRRLDTAFRRSEGWDEFRDFTAALPATTAWVAGIDDTVTTQVDVRRFLPPPRSTAALDTALGRVRDFLDSRSFVLRNQARTNNMLGLVRLHLNSNDSAAIYHRILREALTGNGGTAPVIQRNGYDPAPPPGWTGPIGSLRM